MWSEDRSLSRALTRFHDEIDILCRDYTSASLIGHPSTQRVVMSDPICSRPRGLSMEKLWGPRNFDLGRLGTS